MNSQELEKKIQSLASSQPGATPYTNNRPVRVPGALNGQSAGTCLATICPHVPRDRWENAARDGRLQRSGERITLATPIYAGQRIEFFTPNTVEPPINPNIRVLHLDQHMLALNKPAPLPVHPCGRFNKHSVQWLLAQVDPTTKIRPAHRIDAGTTGILLLSRTSQAAGFVQPQFEARTVRKVYLARVEGVPKWEQFVSHAQIRRAAHGTARMVTGEGDSAETHFRVLQRFGDGTSLVQASPKSGRTNQIRLHLKDAGHPIVGDESYGSRANDPREVLAKHDSLHLHSWRLEFRHPEDGEARLWQAPAPAWSNP